MTPEQLTRLELLLAKTALTSGENQELAFLKTLAASGAPTQSSAGGDADEEENDGEEEEEEEEEEQAPDPAAKAGGAKPSMLDHGRALVTPKSALVKRNSDLTAQVGRLTSEKHQLSQTIAANATTIAGLQTELATVKGELAQAKAENKTLSAKVSEELAGLGVKSESLPAAKSGEKESTYNSEAEVSAAIEAAATWEEKQSILAAWEKQNG